MKKSATAFLAGILCLSLGACGSSAPASDAAQNEEPAAGEQENQEAAEEQPQETPEAEKLTWEVGKPVLIAREAWESYDVFAAIPVTNTSSKNAYMSSASMDLEDASGHLIDSIRLSDYSVPGILAPGETGYFYMTSYGEEAPEPANIVAYATLRESKVDPVRFEVSDSSVSVDEDRVKVTGRVENTTDKDVEYAYVYTLLFDSDNQLIGTVNTYVESLPAGEKIGFSEENYITGISGVDHWEFYAFTHQYQY